MATLDGWFAHIWWAESYFAPVWFAPADEEGQAGLRPEFYGGRGGRPLLRYREPWPEQRRRDDGLAQRVREQWEWLEWLRRRETAEAAEAEEAPPPAEDSPEPNESLAAEEPALEAPPPLPPLAHPFAYRPPAPPPPPVAAPAPPQTRPPADPEFDYAALMAGVDQAVAAVDTSMATFDADGFLRSLPSTINL